MEIKVFLICLLVDEKIRCLIRIRTNNDQKLLVPGPGNHMKFRWQCRFEEACSEQRKIFWHLTILFSFKEGSFRVLSDTNE
jgi:hypothetical protein